jgi:hypothetical protein
MADHSKSKTGLTVVAVLATLLLVGFLVMKMIDYTKPAAVGAARADERAKANVAIRAEGAQALHTYGYADAAKGIVRMPIDEAMKLTIQGYQDAPAFRKDLLTRLDKANPAPPAPAPQKPNEYE